MQESSPLISVIMPAYNAGQYIGEAIESILNQTYHNFEFFIVDDCSSDSTPEIIRQYAQKDTRIKFLPNAENTGQEYIYNKCIALSTGKYIAIMHADDISYPGRFEKQVRFLEQNKDISILGTWFSYLGMSVRNTPPQTHEQIKIMLFECSDIVILHPSVMMRKEDLLVHDLQYVDGYLAEDYKLWVDAITKGLRIANLDEFLVKYRLHPTQLTASKREKQLSGSMKIRSEFAEAFSQGKLTKREVEVIANRFDGISYFELFCLTRKLRELNSSNFFDKKEFHHYLTNRIKLRINQLSKNELTAIIPEKYPVKFKYWLIRLYFSKIASNLFRLR